MIGQSILNILECPRSSHGQIGRIGGAASRNEAQHLADTEVTMNASEQVRIDIEAAKALAEWKSLFAAEVRKRAKGLAAQSGHPNSVTFSDYRMAAKIALQALSSAIHGEHGPDGQNEAA
jgi:hypothetical protein